MPAAVCVVKGTRLLGTPRGSSPVSVLDLITRFEKANGLKLNYKMVERRAGDVPAVWADTTLARSRPQHRRPQW